MRIPWSVLLTILAGLPATACSSSVERSEHGPPGAYSRSGLDGGQFNALIGQRSLDDGGAWGDLSEQLAVGANFVFGPRDALLNWDWGLHYAFDETSLGIGSGATNARAETVESTLGVVHMARFGSQTVVPYAGAGLSLLYAQTEALAGGAVDASDWSFGVYARAGLLVRFRGADHIGFDVRYLTGTTLDLAGSDVSADALVVSVVFGNQF